MQTYNIVLIHPPGYVHALVFHDLGNLLLHSFRTLELPCTLRINAFDPSAVNIVLGYHLLPDPAVFESCRCIPYQLEQLSEQDGWLTPQQPALLARAFEIWDFSSENLAFLTNRGLKRLRLLPIGFHERLHTIAPAVPDIDVLFYGSLNARRRAVLAELQKHCQVTNLFGVYGAERDRFIARSRIVLNIHQFAAQTLEQVRVSYLLNNRCFVVSEDSMPNPYEGAIVASPSDRLVEVCRHYLAAPQERERIAETGYAWFQQRPMADYLKAILSPLTS